MSVFLTCIVLFQSVTHACMHAHACTNDQMHSLICLCIQILYFCSYKNNLFTLLRFLNVSGMFLFLVVPPGGFVRRQCDPVHGEGGSGSTRVFPGQVSYSSLSSRDV